MPSRDAASVIYLALKHGEIADLGATSAYLKLIFDSRTNAIIGRVGFEHYIQDVGTVRGEGQMVNDAACDDDPSLTSYIRGELEVLYCNTPVRAIHLTHGGQGESLVPPHARWRVSLSLSLSLSLYPST